MLFPGLELILEQRFLQSPVFEFQKFQLSHVLLFFQVSCFNSLVQFGEFFLILKENQKLFSLGLDFGHFEMVGLANLLTNLTVRYQCDIRGYCIIQYSFYCKFVVLPMWAPSSLEELKTQVIKAKSYQLKPKDVQNYVTSFEKYFGQFRYATNSDKVIEYFIQIFISTLHLPSNEKIYQCYKKLIQWLNHDPNSKGAYFIIKNAVEICERQFPLSKLNPIEKETNSMPKQDEKELKKRDMSRDRASSKQRDRSQEGERRSRSRQRNSDSFRANLKATLCLVRKGGDKNMLIEDVYKTFVEYYLERLYKQIDQQTKEDKYKPLKLGSHILSELSTLLAIRNKQVVANVSRSHMQQAGVTNLSSYISIYILLELKQISPLLSTVLMPQHQMGKNMEETKIQYPRPVVQAMSNYLDTGVEEAQMEGIAATILSKLVDLMLNCICNSNYSLLTQLHKLYPAGVKQDLTNVEQLLDRLYIHSSIHRLQYTRPTIPTDIQQWKVEFMNSHREYIEATSIHNPNSNLLTINYVLKLCILAHHWLGLPKTQAELNEEIDKMIQIVKKQTGSRANEKEFENWVKQVRRLALDCIDALTCNEKHTSQRKQAQEERIQKLDKHYKKVQDYKQNICKLVESHRNSEREQYGSIKRWLQMQIKDKSNKEKLLENWQIILQCVFQVCRSPTCQLPVIDNQHYSQSSLTALEQMSLRPPPVKKSTKKSYQMEIRNMCCIDIVEMIGCEVEKEELINYMKKLMSETFERVDQQIIRDVIVKDLFLCKCLLLTNHTPKIKFMMEMLFTYYELSPNPSPSDKQSIHQYLPKLLPGVPIEIIVEYCKFVSNRDKLQLRMALFEKQCTGYVSLLDTTPYDMAINNKHRSQMDDQYWQY